MHGAEPRVRELLTAQKGGVGERRSSPRGASCKDSTRNVVSESLCVSAILVASMLTARHELLRLNSQEQCARPGM